MLFKGEREIHRQKMLTFMFPRIIIQCFFLQNDQQDATV